MIKPDVKSITIYVRANEFERFVKGDRDVSWTLFPGESHPIYGCYNQVQISVSAETYQQLSDYEAEKEGVQLEMPF